MPRERAKDLSPVLLRTIEGLKAACTTIAKANTLVDAKLLREQATTMWALFRTREGASEAARAAAELKLRAERRMGQLLPKKPTPKESGETGGRGNKKACPPGTALSRKDRSHCRALATFPEKVFEKTLSTWRDDGVEVTATAMRREIRKHFHQGLIGSPKRLRIGKAWLAGIAGWSVPEKGVTDEELQLLAEEDRQELAKTIASAETQLVELKRRLSTSAQRPVPAPGNGTSQATSEAVVPSFSSGAARTSGIGSVTA
jgi:hypothetical protein